MKSIRNSQGMSLIELMIAVAIVGIIAAIAYPNYTDYMNKARRADATGDAMELAQYMERFYTENGRYDQDRAGNAINPPITQSPVGGNNPHYTITLNNLTATTFTMNINRASAVQQSDAICLDLSLDHLGVRCSHSGAHCSNGGGADVQAVNRCW